MKRFYQFIAVTVLALLAGCTSDPKVQSARYLANGNKFYDRGKLKEASIMYRRALQKNQKNADAWYKLGIVNYTTGGVGEARLDFVRVADLAEESKNFDATAQDAISRTADLDYFVYMRLPTDKFKPYRDDLDTRAKQLNTRYPKSFNAYRVQGLANFARIPSDRKPEVRLGFAKQALEQFMLADKLKPYDPGVGFPIFSVLGMIGQSAEAEKYAREMIARKTADDRVYNTLWELYLKSNQLPKAEEIRKLQVANNPKDGTALIKLAYHYFVTHRQPEMQAALARLSSDLKTFPNAYLLIGDLYFSNQDYPNAVQNYEQGVKVDPNEKAAYLKRSAEALTLSNKTPEAAKVIAELLKAFPNDPEAIAMDVAQQLNTAKPADADRFIGILQPLLAKTNATQAERSTILHFNLGRAYALKGDAQSRDQARLHFQEAVSAQDRPYVPAYMALAELELERGDNPQAADHAATILRVAPLNVTARLIRTMALSNMGQADQAREELQTILKMRPDSHDARFQLARLNLMQKRYKEAEGQFDELWKQNDPRGLAGVVESKVQQGHAQDAIQMLQAELAKAPTNPNFRYTLATLNYNIGKYQEAANQFRQVLDQNPNADLRLREDWTLRWGESLRQLGDVNGAVAAFRKAAELAPKDTTPILEIAMLFTTKGQMEEARQQYERVLKLQPDNPIALNNVAYAKADSGTDLDQALTFAQRAQTKSPQDPNIQDTVGLIYFKKDALDSSIQIFTELVRRVPDNPTYHLHLAMALYKKGDRPQARRELDLARRHGPSGREQVQIKDLMSKFG